MNKARDKAYEVSRQVLWSSLISYYKSAYDVALQKVAKRIDRL